MILVRDNKVVGASSADKVADRIIEWLKTDVETQISSSMVHRTTNQPHHPSDSWISIATILDIAIMIMTLQSSLPLSGKPCIVLATDGQSLPCPTILEYVQSTFWNDVAIHVLDVSEDDYCPSVTKTIQGLPDKGKTAIASNIFI